MARTPAPDRERASVGEGSANVHPVSRPIGLLALTTYFILRQQLMCALSQYMRICIALCGTSQIAGNTARAIYRNKETPKSASNIARAKSIREPVLGTISSLSMSLATRKNRTAAITIIATPRKAFATVLRNPRYFRFCPDSYRFAATREWSKSTNPRHKKCHV